MQHRTNPVVGGTVEETPLAHACSRGFLGIVELLIDSGSDVNYLCSVCLNFCNNLGKFDLSVHSSCFRALFLQLGLP